MRPYQTLWQKLMPALLTLLLVASILVTACGGGKATDEGTTPIYQFTGNGYQKTEKFTLKEGLFDFWCSFHLTDSHKWPLEKVSLYRVTDKLEAVIVDTVTGISHEYDEYPKTMAPMNDNYHKYVEILQPGLFYMEIDAPGYDWSISIFSGYVP